MEWRSRLTAKSSRRWWETCCRTHSSSPGLIPPSRSRVGASAERVLIEIQDECGGLPRGNVNELFRPFEQRSADRTGLGLGLAFSRWGVEANNGRIYARNLPERDASSPSTCRGSQFQPWQSSSLEAPTRRRHCGNGPGVVSTTEQRAWLRSHIVGHRMGKVRRATGFTNR